MMPSRYVHRNKGSCAAMAEYIDACREKGIEPDLLSALLLAYLGGIAATLPDAIDDSSSGPNHRGIAHSCETYMFLKNQHQKARAEGRVGEAALIRATMTHHEDDALTPMGLPSIASRIFRWFLR
jgi:hypothetical protein